MTGPVGLAHGPIHSLLVVNAAAEGVPIGALNRIFNRLPDKSMLNIRMLLRHAVKTGRLLSLPREDWPPFEERAPCLPTPPLNSPKPQSIDDEDMIIIMARTFRTTRLQSRVFLRLLRRDQCTKKMLHDAVEENRGNPAEPAAEKIVDVVICHLRKKLKAFRIKVVNMHGCGFYVSADDRAKGLALVERTMMGEGHDQGKV
jgi:hypothetical protein